MIQKAYNEHTDKSLPIYDITCLDNELSPFDPLSVFAFHFRSDISAKSWAEQMAKHNNWHSWEIYCGNRRVFFINKFTGEVFPERKKK